MPGELITDTTSPSTADAVCGPPAPGPESVTSVIAWDSSVTALKGPPTAASGCPPYRKQGYTRTLAPPSRRSATPSSFKTRPNSFA